MAKTYSQKLRDPMWKAKRLQVIEARGKQCEECGSPSNLQVHHTYYEFGLEPWEYPDSALKCLCDPCHSRRHQLLDGIKLQLERIDNEDLERVLFFAMALNRPLQDRIQVTNWAQLSGVAGAFLISDYQAMKFVDDFSCVGTGLLQFLSQCAVQDAIQRTQDAD